MASLRLPNRVETKAMHTATDARGGTTGNDFSDILAAAPVLCREEWKSTPWTKSRQRSDRKSSGRVSKRSINAYVFATSVTTPFYLLVNFERLVLGCNNADLCRTNFMQPKFLATINNASKTEASKCRSKEYLVVS